MSRLKALAGQTLVYGMGTIVPRLLNFLLLTPFYTRIFQKGEFGVVTELYAYVAFLLVILTYGMETTFFRFSQDEKVKDKTFSTSVISLIITSTLFIFFIILFQDSIAGALNYEGKSYYILVLSIIVGMDAVTSIPFARLRLANKAKKFSLLKIINVGLNVGLNFFFLTYLPALQGSNPDAALLIFYSPTIGVGYTFIANLIASGVTLLLLLPDIKAIKLSFDFTLFKKMISYSFPLLIVGVAGMVNEVADKIFLKFLIPASLSHGDPDFIMAQVGIYGANYKIAVFMTLFIQMFRYAAEPFFFNAAKDKDAKELYARVMKYFVLFGLFIFLLVTLFLDITKHFIDAKFHEGLHIVPIVLMANFFIGIYYNLSVWYKLTDNTKKGATIAIIGAIITIVLNILLVPLLGYTGAAWATFICYLSMMCISYFWGEKYYPIEYELKSIGLYTGVAVALYFIFQWMKPASHFYSAALAGLLLITFIMVPTMKEKWYKLSLKGLF